MSLQACADKLRRLNVNQAHGRASPHKICMLLAVLDLARAGGLPRNEIRFSPPLLERYRVYFDAVRSERDHPNPWFPFFHLGGALRGGGESFWHLVAVPGRESVVAAMSTATTARAITDNIAFARLDDELYALVCDPRGNDALAAELAAHWFDRGLQELRRVADEGRQISDYEHRIRDLDPGRKDVREVPRAVRDPAFRRVVTEVYDYRCAATGTRLLLADGTAMVEAAHIHPHAESLDDDPRNGLALTPDMHWAMDRFLIAPTPDYRWRVSSALDERIPEHRFLTALDGKPLILPAEKRWYPKEEALAWRMARLD